jgi:bifunctional UDP-N-acetylglucosamine pyrophosphorylase / glucosamine-1-phosphate N-acetyltransferase
MGKVLESLLRSVVLERTKRESSINVVFERTDGYIGDLLSCDPLSSPYSSISFLGKPLIIYNIEKISEACGKITGLSLPAGLSSTADKIARFFPEIQIDEYDSTPRVSDSAAVIIPLTSVVVKSVDGKYSIKSIHYPWDILKATECILQTEVRSTSISKDSSIESGSVIDGPCVIESGVSIDSFCKLKGPVYIGADSKIGTGSLVRNSMLDHSCTIGFSCEVARSYVAANDTFPHYDAILDSVIGEHTWMGGYVAITNVMLNNKNVRYKIDGNLVETGLSHFGAVIGHNSTIGAGVVILPGRYMPPWSFIPPHVLFSSIDEKKPVGPRMG